MATTTPGCITNPTKVYARLFEVLAGMYGARFVDAWKGVKQEVMQGVWEKELAGYTMAEITAGVEACKSHKFPPTLPEFLMMCRPPINYDLAYAEAVEQMARRGTRTDYWSHPAIYWAAARLGPDFKALPYPAIKYRWQRGVDAAMRDFRLGLVGEVPPKPLALPNDAKLTPMPDHIRAQLAHLMRKPGE